METRVNRSYRQNPAEEPDFKYKRGAASNLKRNSVQWQKENRQKELSIIK